MITLPDNVEITIEKSHIGNKNGWSFCVGKNFVSALYKTQSEAKKALEYYLETGKFDWYGSAE